jgi:hypothetical protein
MSKGQRIFFFFGILLVLIEVAMILYNPSDSTPRKPVEYVVEAGDTCSQIAHNFNVSIMSLIEQNKLTPDCNLSVGQLLYIQTP